MFDAGPGLGPNRGAYRQNVNLESSRREGREKHCCTRPAAAPRADAMECRRVPEAWFLFISYCSSRKQLLGTPQPTSTSALDRQADAHPQKIPVPVRRFGFVCATPPAPPCSERTGMAFQRRTIVVKTQGREPHRRELERRVAHGRRTHQDAHAGASKPMTGPTKRALRL